MQSHTIIYFLAFGLDPDFDHPTCEICEKKANDLHHIDARGMGGDPTKSKDRIENLMALCRSCHVEYGDLKYCMSFLFMIHKELMNRENVTYDTSYIDACIVQYSGYASTT